jgi:hypothetical protein
LLAAVVVVPKQRVLVVKVAMVAAVTEVQVQVHPAFHQLK